MTNKTCKYRRICGHATSCYEHTQNEEEWCPYAKGLLEEGVELELKHWNSIPLSNGEFSGMIPRSKRR